MTISSIGSQPLTQLTGNSSADIGATSAQIAETISNLLGQDTTSVPAVAQIQSQTSQLQAMKSNVSLASSQTDTLEESLSQQLNVLAQLQQLAAEASGGNITDTQRAQLNIEYQALEQQLNPPEFNGLPIASTTLSQALGSSGSENTGPTLDVPDTSSQGLGIAGTDISTQQDAQNAQGLLQTASNTLQSALANAGSFSQALDYAGAAVETALTNYQAAATDLGPDFATDATQLSELITQQNAQVAVEAQANGIPASVLNLLNNPVETGSAA